MPAYTYDPAIPTDKDAVRMLSGDTDVDSNARGVTKARLSDEELEWLLREEANKYLAAARACEFVIAKTGGLVAKQVDNLRLQWGDNASAKSVYTEYIRHLREKGALLTHSKPRIFRVLGSCR